MLRDCGVAAATCEVFVCDCVFLEFQARSLVGREGRVGRIRENLEGEMSHINTWEQLLT
jgi:late competence protein required for DNA uptake (superfamily II DNA/RNA helicase)